MLGFSTQELPGPEMPQVFLRQLHPGIMRTTRKITEKRVTSLLQDEGAGAKCVKANWMQRSHDFFASKILVILQNTQSDATHSKDLF